MTTSEEIHLLCLGFSLAVRLAPRVMHASHPATPSAAATGERPEAGARTADADSRPESSPVGEPATSSR